MKTKIAFNDIPNVIERDEMKEVFGGNVSSVYKEDSTVVSGRTDLLYGSSISSWFTSVGDRGFMGSGSSYTTTDPNEIRQIMSALTGNTYSYNSTTYDTQPRPTDCFFQCLGWVSAMFGDRTHDAKYYEKMYAFTNSSGGANALYDFLTGSGGGVTQNQVMSFTSMFFNTTDYSGASIQFLARYINPSTNPYGENSLMGLYKGDAGDLHAVMITSIEGNRVNFYDPQKMTASYIDKSKMISYYGLKSK